MLNNQPVSPSLALSLPLMEYVVPVHDVTSSTCCNAWPLIRRYTDFKTGREQVDYGRRPKWPNAENAAWLVPAANSKFATTSRTRKRKAKRDRQRKAKRGGKRNATASGASAHRPPRRQSMRRFLSVYATCAIGCLTICWGSVPPLQTSEGRLQARPRHQTSCHRKPLLGHACNPTVVRCCPYFYARW